MPTSSEKATEKVEWIVTTGNIPDNIDSGYEKEQIVRRLNDYATRPSSSDRVVERAEEAIEQLTSETDEETR